MEYSCYQEFERNKPFDYIRASCTWFKDILCVHWMVDNDIGMIVIGWIKNTRVLIWRLSGTNTAKKNCPLG